MDTPETFEKYRDFDVPIRTYQHNGLSIQGYSRAAFRTYWRIPELKIGFDLGASPLAFISTNTWAISHTHADHISGLPSLLARRDILGMRPPRIIVPGEKLPAVRDFVESSGRIQEYDLSCELIGVQPGDRVELSGGNFLTCFRTDHTIISLGYIVWNERRKLKSEFKHLPGKEIERLRKNGETITELVPAPLVAYTGDTRIAGLKLIPDLLKVPILIMEATFLDSVGDHSQAYGHTHINDIAGMAELFFNEKIVLGHFSSKYTPDEIKEKAARSLPGVLKEKIVLWI